MTRPEALKLARLHAAAMKAATRVAATTTGTQTMRRAVEAEERADDAFYKAIASLSGMTYDPEIGDLK